MIYARQPTLEERRELQRMTRQAVGRVSQRARMILLSIQPRTVPEVAALFAVSSATVRFWIRRFNAHGPPGLDDDPRSGRPRKVGPQVLERIMTMRQDDPQHAGDLATCWTVVMVGAALVHQLGVRLSASTLRRALHGLGLRWGRPRLAMPLKIDPEKASKQRVIAKAVVEAGPAAAILYGEESRGHLLPLRRAMWCWIGQPLRIPTPGTNVTRAWFGAWNSRTGRWGYLLRARARTADFLAFLAHLLVAYPEGPILLVVDNFGSHTARAVTAWLGAPPRRQLFSLPK